VLASITFTYNSVRSLSSTVPSTPAKVIFLPSCNPCPALVTTGGSASVTPVIVPLNGAGELAVWLVLAIY
jgi:hypothetical protein